MSREKGAKFIFHNRVEERRWGGREGGQKSNINLFLSKHQQIKGINGVSEGGRAGGKGVAKLGFFDQKDNRAPHHFCKKYLYEGIDLET